MKIRKEKELLNYIDRLNDINELNMSLSNMFLSIISNPEVTNEREVKILSTTYKRNEQEILLDKIVEYWGIDLKEDDNKQIYDHYIKNSFKLLKEKDYQNAYQENIKISKVKDGDYELILDTYQPYEIIPIDDVKLDEEGIEITSLGYFDKPYRFLALNYKGVTWMSLNPNEINTMRDDINNVEGNLLVFGLGLGYFAYMASLKDNVKKITIVEKDPKIINLFKKHLLPQFAKKEKITIIEGDAIKYNIGKEKYDFLYIDLWHNCLDGSEIYLHYKKIENKYPNTKFLYWLNVGFEALFRRVFISLLKENTLGYNDSNYKQEENEFDHLINRLYFATKNLQINNTGDIDKLLESKNLMALF